MSRTVIIGDVHGCIDELRELLDCIGYCSSDRLVFAGDMIARGPGSCEVLDLFEQTAACGVLGNHEFRMLAVRQAHREGRPPPKLGPAHLQLLGELEERHWRMMEALPLSLELESHGVRVVHAGICPSLAFEQQDPWTLLHIRTLRPDGSAASSAGFLPWASAYVGEPHIVFGHNSRQALQLHPCATGLDTACVYGGELTALVLSEQEWVEPDPSERHRQLYSVTARARYYLGLTGAPEGVRARWELSSGRP